MPQSAQPPKRGRVIAIGGLSGTGKSTLSRALAVQWPSAIVLRSDVERKRLFGVAETTRLGADGYTSDVSARVYTVLAESAARALATGATVIVDAVFAKPAERASIETVASDTGAIFIGLWLTAPIHVQITRVEARRNDASDATADIVTRQASADIGQISWHHIDASHSPGATLTAAIAILDQHPSRND